MKSLRAPIVLAAAMFGLAGCASAPSVDLDAAQEWYDGVVDAESDGPGSIGVVGMQIGPDRSDAGEVRVDFAQPTEVSRVDIRCFGGTTAVVRVNLPGVADGVSTMEVDVLCDEDPHSITLDAPAADAITVSATAPARTYLHATALQDLTIER